MFFHIWDKEGEFKQRHVPMDAPHELLNPSGRINKMVTLPLGCAVGPQVDVHLIFVALWVHQSRQ